MEFKIKLNMKVVALAVPFLVNIKVEISQNKLKLWLYLSYI
jgi:hypothetical protein